MAALFTGQEWWLAALLVGYVVVVPITAMVFGDEEDVAEWWDDADEWSGEDEAETDAAQSGGRGRDAGGAPAGASSGASTGDDESALERIRRRYAEGELTEAQFERKLERLLETETLEDVEDRRWARDRERELREERSDAADAEREPETERS